MLFLGVAIVGAIVGGILGAVVGFLISRLPLGKSLENSDATRGERNPVVRNCGIGGAVLGALAAVGFALWVIASLPGVIALP